MHADEDRLRWLRNDPLPQFTIAEHDVGFVVGGSRKADGDALYWRITQFMLPAHSVTPSAMPDEIYFGYTWVPITDESCWVYVYALASRPPAPGRGTRPVSRRAAGARWPCSGRGSCRSPTARTTT